LLIFIDYIEARAVRGDLGHVCSCFSADFFSQKAEKSKTEINDFQLSFKSLKNKLMKKLTKSLKAHLKLFSGFYCAKILNIYYKN
jgi:hypothetical protein